MEAALKINPALRGKVTTVAEGRVGRPDLSGDGRTVVYQDMVQDTAEIMRWRDGQSEQLTHDRFPDAWAKTNRDGSTVVWCRFSAESPADENGQWDVVRWQDGQAEFVANGPGNEMSAQVSADGGVVVWDDDGDGTFSQWNIGRWQDGKGETVTSGPGLKQFPVLSGDGQRLVFRRENEGKSNYWLRDEAGVVKPFLVGDFSGASLNYDGSLMAYTDHSKADEDLFVLSERDMSKRLVAGEREVDETWASLSGDGQTVAWTNFDRRKGNPADTNIVVRRGDQQVQVTYDDGGLNAMPKLSEDGNTLLWYWVDKDDSNRRKILKADLSSLFEN